MVAGRKQVGGNISFCGDISNDFNFVFDIRLVCKKFTFCITFENVFRHRIFCLIRFLKPFHIGLIQENLCLQNIG